VVEVLSLSSGYSVDYYLSMVGTGRENYYTGAVAEGEPPGRWHGAGAEALGLTGLVDHQDMKALYEGFLDPRDENFRNPEQWDQVATLGHAGRKYATAEEIYQRSVDAEPYADAERREQLRLDASKRERKNVAFFDATFSVQKSITVLHAAFEAEEVKARAAGDEQAAEAWAAHKQAVEDAIWAGNRAGLDYLAETAGYSRVGHHGGAAGRYVDSHDWTVASFFQHDSRDRDPQLHIHNVILNRVLGPDGIWRTLDGRALYTHRGAAGTVAQRSTTEHLTRSLRVLAVMRPDGKAREIAGTPERVNDLFSSRRRAVTGKAAQLVAAFQAKFSRAPNALELDRLQRQATMATRKSKSHDTETVQERLERWDRQLRAEVAGGLATVATDVLALAHTEPPRAQPFDPDAVIDTALAEVQATKAAWTQSDLARAIDHALPDYLGGLDGEQVARLIDGLTGQGLEQRAVSLTANAPGAATLPDELRLANGDSAYERPGSKLYATGEHVRSERALRAAAVERGAVFLSAERVTGFVTGLAESGIELGVDQATAVRGVLTSGAAVEALVGPAGTGKSFVLGVLAEAWQDATLCDGAQRLVFGLAASQIATDVLADEGLTARNISQWLATQQRLTTAGAHTADREWQLSAGDLVVVDESAMADTPALAAIHGYVRQAGAKLLLTGDHRQLAAVGAGGGMELIAATAPTYELTEARRFTHAWERTASLQLREGDETALATYRKHGRILDGGTIEHAEQSAARAWLGDTLAGKHSLLIVDTNEQAARLSAQIRADLVRLGRVEEAGVPLGLQGTVAGVGDLIQARRNGWLLASIPGNRRGPINREQYRVLQTLDDGGLVVAPILGRTSDGEQLGEQMTMPEEYVNQHVALGYAATVHASQGLTVDTSHTIATGRTGQAALYVGLTRGRHANTAHVCTQTIPEDAPTGTVHQVIRQDPLAVLATGDEQVATELAAIVQAERNAEDAASIRKAAERLADAAELATAGRTATMLDRLVDDGTLAEGQRARIAADDGMVSLTRVLRQAEIAGHDPRQVLRGAVTSRDLGDARSLASVLHHRISDTIDLHPAGDTFAEWTPTVDNPAWQRHLDDLAAVADSRRNQLTATVVAEPPAWAIQELGPVPDDPTERIDWAKRAGAVAAHRELTGHDDPDIALLGPPKQGQAEAYASWRSAWRALGRDEATRAEVEMSDGQLRVRVRGYERELTWQPDYVAPEMSGTIQAANRHRATAELRTAEAQQETDAERRADLEREADEAQALAQVLEQRAAELEKADEIRARWYAHTAETRTASDRARDELACRGIDPDQPDQHITAEEWLAAHTAEQTVEDPHRQITDEADFAEFAQQRDADVRAVGTELSTDTAETNVVDIRDETADEPKRATRAEDDWIRVPTAQETADSVTRAQRALAELEQRQAADQRHAAEDARTQQLGRWHADSQAERNAREIDASGYLDRSR
jgi:conjugative relaxase-like TrwC/TraI family protein